MKENLNIDYGSSIKNLANQAFTFNRYKQMPTFAAIVLAIILSPLMLLFVVGIGVFYLIFPLFKILSSPMEYLDAVLHREGENVKHATQFIIYLIGFPTVFLLNVLLAFLSIILYIIFILLSVTSTLFSLGGCDFKPFLNEQPEIRELRPLEDPHATAVFDLLWAFVWITGGLVYEIVNVPSKGIDEFILPGMVIGICYIIAVSVMAISHKYKDEANKPSTKIDDKNTPKEKIDTTVSEEKVIEISDDYNGGFKQYKRN